MLDARGDLIHHLLLDSIVGRGVGHDRQLSMIVAGVFVVSATGGPRQSRASRRRCGVSHGQRRIACPSAGRTSVVKIYKRGGARISSRGQHAVAQLVQ